jgi:serine/threonine protein kinase
MCLLHYVSPLKQPIEVIGQGSFGVVLLAEYRGTKVAIKRAVKVKNRSKSSRRTGSTGHSAGMSTEMDVTNSMPLSTDEDGASGESEDIESQRESVGESHQSSRARGQMSGKSGSKSKGSLWSIRFLQEEFGHSSHHWFNPFGKKKDYRTRFRDSFLGDSMSGSMSTTKTLKARLCPWFDEQTRRENEFLVEMRVLSRLRHPCITTVMGAVVSSSHEPMLVMEYMEYGSIHDLLLNETMVLSGDIILQMLRDVSSVVVQRVQICPYKQTY